MADHEEQATNDAAARVRGFAKFFKSYMGVSAIVTAALPIPVAELKLIPMIEEQRHLLAVYTSLFCFLTFAFLFFCRHSLARLMFRALPPRADEQRPRFLTLGRANLVAFILMLMALSCVALYHYFLGFKSVSLALALPPAAAPSAAVPVLALPSWWHIQTQIMLAYLGIFVFSEAAFVLMATKEYLLDVLKVSEADLVAVAALGWRQFSTEASAARTERLGS